jgi:hypothetical protein
MEYARAATKTIVNGVFSAPELRIEPAFARHKKLLANTTASKKARFTVLFNAL